MSNKIVPNIYRAVIDDVIANIKPEFEEYGVNEDVLADLQAKWEAKVIASHVAEFDSPQQTPQQQQQPHAYGAHPIHIMQSHPYASAHHPYAPVPPGPGQPTVKSEPVDSRYILNASYQLPPLQPPQLNSIRPGPAQPLHIGGQTSVLSFPPGPPPNAPPSMTNGSAGTPIGRAYIPPGQASSSNASSAPARIPQVDGAAGSDDEDEDSPSPPAFAPRSTHPSLPQPQSQKTSSSTHDEAINSDLDDSDSENEEEADEGGVGESDIVFCTYDKVARVKNKWKCVLKDGMIHVNGRDYLFQKCTGEFEW